MLPLRSAYFVLTSLATSSPITMMSGFTTRPAAPLLRFWCDAVRYRQAQGTFDPVSRC
jgi:hypothetical protein